jgi:hypothetical protein
VEEEQEHPQQEGHQVRLDCDSILGSGPVCIKMESSKQVSIQILFWCCDVVYWAIGSCIASEPIRGDTRGHAHPNTLFIQQSVPHYDLVLFRSYLSSNSVVFHSFGDPT